jgi:GrpB-like predicted nucleotidyltransferase (UPF0157 family)
MPAKDIVDLVIECPRGTMAAVISALGSIGYTHQGDRGIPGREAFRPVRGAPAENLPPHHLYACEELAHELLKQLAFRDFLHSHPDRMLWLAQQKRLADQGAQTRDEYIQNKDQAYSTITAESLKWAAESANRV